MKQSENVSSSTRKSRKAHHNAPSHIRRKLMSCHLATELKNKHGIRSMPVRKDDEVMVMRGLFKGHSGRVVKVYRKRWILHIERLNKEKANGQAVPFPIQPSNVQITKLKLDKDRNNLINRKARGTAESKNQKKEKWPGAPGMDKVD